MYDIKKMTLEEKVGQMLGFAFHGTTYTEELRKQIEDIKVGYIDKTMSCCCGPRTVAAFCL